MAECEEFGAVNWQWQSADAAMAKARFGGDETGPNPTDRAPPGTKRSLLVEAEGGPLAVVVGGANVHDCKLLEATLEAIIVERPKPQDIEQQRHPARLWVEGANTRLALQVQSNLSAL